MDYCLIHIGINVGKAYHLAIENIGNVPGMHLDKSNFKNFMMIWFLLFLKYKDRIVVRSNIFPLGMSIQASL